MSEQDPHRITTEAALRALVGAELPGVETKILDRLDEPTRAFLERAPFLVLSTSDREGRLDASPKGDGPGFVLIEDERTIVIPDRPGNRLVFGHRNILENPRVGLLLMIPGTSETLRINGHAELTRDPALLERLATRGRPALLAIRVRIEQCFLHCGKALLRAHLWDPAKWGARHRVSFGEIYAERTGADEAVARQIDAAIEVDYRDNL
jgi:PPOX class probable FMN-dependent enzyme